MRGLFFNPGFAHYRDLSWPYISDYWLSFGRFVWDSYFQKKVQIQQKVIYLWLSCFPPEISERLIYLIILVTMSITMYRISYKFTKSIVASTISTLFFIFNPVVITRIQHKLLLLSYALLPLFFYLAFKLFNDISKERKIKLKRIILISVVWLMMSTSPHWALFSLLIIFYTSVTILFFTKVKIYEYIKKSTISLFAITALYTGLSSFWIIPYLFQSRLAALQPPYVFTEEVLSLLSRNAQLLNVIRLHSYWRPGDLFSSLPLPSIFWMIAVFTIPILAIIPLLFTRSYRSKGEEKVYVLIAVLLVILIFLSKGDNPPIGRVYAYLSLKIPLVSSIGWLFRDPHKWMFLLSFCYSFFIGFLVSKIKIIINRKCRSKYIFIVSTLTILAIFATPLIAGYPLLTGDLNGKLKPQQVPYDHKQMDQWLRRQSVDFKVTVYPSTPPWGVMKPTIRYDSYWRFSVDSLLNNKTNKFGVLLNPWSVKYIVIRTRPSKSEFESKFTLTEFKKSKNVIKFLKYQKDIKFVKKFGTLYVFENLDYSSPVCISRNNLAVLDDLAVLNALTQVNSLNKPMLSIYFVSKIVKKNFNSNVYNHYIIRDKKNTVYHFIANHTEVIKPFYATTHHNPQKLWSKAMTTDPLHGAWHPYLERFDIQNWQFDYGYGLVFTWATKRIPENLEVKDNDIIYSWNFDTEKEFLEWKNTTPEKQFNAIHKLEWKKGALIAKLYNSTWGWKTVRSPFIPAETGDVFTFKLKIRGENAHKVHIKVLEFDSNKKYLTGKYVKSIGSGTFDWKDVQFDYIVQNPNTSYIQLQIWHGHKTDKPSPNVIWVDDVRVYDITKYAKPVTLDIPFKVDKDDNYKLFIRYFKNQKGGEIKVYLDNEPIVINTKDQLNKFVWKDLGTFYLERGKHKIILENIKGFNAVNLFALIPEKEYYKAKEEIEKLLQNKTIIYLFEAESDLYRENAEISKEFGGEASNGEVLKFVKNGKAWHGIEIVKNGTYRLALKGVGEFKVRIGDHEFILKSNSLNFTYTPLFDLTKGKYKLEILASKNSHLDVIWLYSTETNQTIEELFEIKEKPAEIINYTKINPTLWKVKVNATKPFMLSFAEAYDPLWEARVYKDGKKVEVVKSIPLYSVINGFWIDETGNLEIVIRYKPQDWFEIGLIISVSTLIFCLFYLFYDWRRSRKDKWARILEKKFKAIIKLGK